MELTKRKYSTKATVRLISTPELAGNAIRCLYARQTETEQNTKSTIFLNRMGFSATDAYMGSYLANYVSSGNTLSGDFLARAMKLVYKYRKQLTKILNQD